MKYCIKCGHQLDDEDIFCDKCGEPADCSKVDSTPAEENIQSDNYSPKKKNRFIKIFAALSAAVVVCIGGYLLIDWIQIEINAKKINDLYEETRQQMQTEATSIVTNVQTEPVSIAPAKTTSAKTTAIQETTKATEKKPEVHYSLYTAILNELTLGYSYYDLSNCYYTLYDINGDGIYELIINFSDDSVESSFIIYTIKDNEVKYIDEIPSFSSSLSEKDKKLYLHYGHSGYQIVKRIDFDGSNITVTTVSEENNVSDYTVYGYALQGSRLSDTARIKALYSKEELNNMPNIKVKLTDERLPQGIGVFLNVSGNYDYYEYICFEYNFSGGEPYLNNGSSSEKQLKISAFSANVSKVVVVVTPYSSDGIAGETITAEYIPVYESSQSIKDSSQSVKVTSCNKKGQLNTHGGIVSGYSTSYVVNNGVSSKIRDSLGNAWHVTAVKYCESRGVLWYELYDTDDNDYYGWVDSKFIDFYSSNSNSNQNTVSQSVKVTSCNKNGQINGDGVAGFTTSYVVNGGAVSTVRDTLGNTWHVTAVNTCTSRGIVWYELYDTDDNDYYGWVDANYIRFY